MGLAFLITSDKLQLLSERKVLKEAEYAALLDAEAVVEAAQFEARRIVEHAHEQAEYARAAGHAEGLERARSEQAQRLVSEAAATQQQLHALRTAMAQIVVKAVGQFMADADPALLFEAALLRVEALIRNEPFLTVHVTPEHEDDMRTLLERLTDEAGWGLNAALQVDLDLPPGSCRIVTASGTLDIGIEAQLDAFRQAIERSALPAAAHAQR